LKAKNELTGPNEHVKHLFIDRAQMLFYDGQEVENNYRRIGDYFEHRLLELHKIAFWGGFKGRK
jgi:hypothetical protein